MHGISATALRPSGRLRFSDGSRASVRGSLRQLGARGLTSVYRRTLFLAYKLTNVRIPVYNAAIDVRFAILGATDVPDYLRFRPEVEARDVEERLAGGNRCFVSWYGDRIVDACWTATGLTYVRYMRRYLEIPPGDIYSFDSYTSSEYRGQGIYMARNSFTASQNQREGFHRSIALVAYENYAAWLVLKRSGLETIGMYQYLRLPFGGFSWQSSLPDCAMPRLVRHRSESDAISPLSGAGAS